MKILGPLAIILSISVTAFPLRASDQGAAATAINALGIDLLAKTGAGKNALLSPYSIQETLAMTYTGADGTTRAEMQNALHFPKDDAVLGQAFSTLQKDLASMKKSSVTLSTASRLYAQSGFAFRAPFLESTKQNYDAPLEEVNFAKDTAGVTDTINAWVEGQTRKRIRNLIPKNALNTKTRLVLVNAIYMKAAWAEAFEASATKLAPYNVNGVEKRDVPTMHSRTIMGYAKRKGYTAVALSYAGSELQFLVLLPDDARGLPALESRLTTAMLADCSQMKSTEVDLALPKFRIEPPLMDLSADLKMLGMKSAFDEPEGSADFSRMAPRKGNDALYFSAVFHKTFLALDENGTEAAAAAAVIMDSKSIVPTADEKPKVVHVDRPFLFAIQHRASGACLFLGRVTDPR